MEKSDLDKAAEEIEEMWRRCGEHIDEAVSHIAKAKIAWGELRPKN